MKKIFKSICLIIFILVLVFIYFITTSDNTIRSVKSDKELLELYDNNYNYENMSFIERLVMLPFSIFYPDSHIVYNTKGQYIDVIEDAEMSGTVSKNASSKDYSKTNIQVENVDEADIIKTDGDYIYSISESKVIITNVNDPNNIIIETTIDDSGIPNDLILYNNKLVVIASNDNVNYYKGNTLVKVYDITKKGKPKLEKSFELYEPYYTSRCIDGRLYVFSSGMLRKEKNKISRTYKEDNEKKELDFNNIKYISDNRNNIQTLIGEINLNNLDNNLRLSSYLMNVSNAYISEESIYLLNSNYNYDGYIDITKLFGFKGVFGIFDDEYDYSYEEKTKIYKFDISKNGVKYKTNTEVEGHTINQYSLDEKDGNLRVALEGNDGTRIEVLDKNLKLLGKTDSVAEDEKMYSSRFIGDKAYFVTYRNTDPLFVIDLSDSKNPKVMGELKVPGYSTYLHPYDDTHLIGIGMETQENIIRDSDGKVISTGVSITGMKMSLFDVSDINNPKQIAKTTIGDRRTVSAILSNPKALLFSKEKNLIAIPVNNYDEDFIVEDSEEVESEIESYVSYSKPNISEGYFVYNIDLENGFKLKGIINHEKTNNDYYYYRSSKLLRGLYIEDNLYTVSESAIKVNALEDLKEISSINIKKGVN